MKRPSKKLVRPTVRTPKEDGGTVGSASLYVEVDAGAGQHVAFDLTIIVHPRDASSLAPVVGELETPSAELWDEHSPDEEQDDPADGPYVVTLFGKRVPVSQLKTKRRRFGRRR
jgi:hypothetical protein